MDCRKPFRKNTSPFICQKSKNISPHQTDRLHSEMQQNGLGIHKKEKLYRILLSIIPLFSLSNSILCPVGLEVRGIGCDIWTLKTRTNLPVRKVWIIGKMLISTYEEVNTQPDIFCTHVFGINSSKTKTLLLQKNHFKN